MASKKVASRVACKKEPVAKFHRYVVTILKGKKTCVKYPSNRQGVRDIIAAAPKGAVIEVYSSFHSFKEAFEIK